MNTEHKIFVIYMQIFLIKNVFTTLYNYIWSYIALVVHFYAHMRMCVYNTFDCSLDQWCLYFFLYVIVICHRKTTLLDVIDIHTLSIPVMLKCEFLLLLVSVFSEFWTYVCTHCFAYTLYVSLADILNWK